MCQQGCFSPLLETQSQGIASLWTPAYIFLENGTQTVKMQFDTIPQKIQNRCNLHPCEDKKLQRFSFCRSRRFFQKLSASKFQHRADAEHQNFSVAYESEKRIVETKQRRTEVSLPAFFTFNLFSSTVRLPDQPAWYPEPEHRRWKYTKR